MLLTDFIGIVVVDGYNPITQTISDLAIAKKAWIQDIGSNLFAAAFVTCAIGLFSMSLGGWKWKTGAAMLLLSDGDILLISEHDKYAGSEGVGAAIHIYLVCVFRHSIYAGSLIDFLWVEENPALIGTCLACGAQ